MDQNKEPLDLPFESFDFIRTPSYNGSYNNSPYSNHSELSFGPEADPFSLFDDIPPITDYDPAEYDNPNSNSLLMFNDPSEYMSSYDPTISLSLTPAPHDDLRSFDYSSPSSNGGGESETMRSRASSVSSQHEPSPRLEVVQNFENLTFHSPNWATNPLPQLSPPSQPRSPPQLLIPDAPPPPKINAPEGDGSAMSHGGPQLHIVPATPVSGGGVTAQAPFRSSLETLHQEDKWNQPQEDSYGEQQQQQQQQQKQQFPFDHAISNDFLFPLAPRLRSKSDTQLSPPQWDTAPSGIFSDSALNESVPGGGTVHMNDVLPTDGHYQTQTPQPPSLSHHYTYGPPSSSNALRADNTNVMNPFLSPNPEPFVNLRRAKSDGGGPRPGHTRQSRSEDLRSPTASANHTHLFPPSSQHEFLARHQGQFLHPRPGTTVGGGGGTHYRRASIEGGTVRTSPYPSPHASPRGRYDELPSDGMHMMHTNTNNNGHNDGLRQMNDRALNHHNINLRTSPEMELLGPTGNVIVSKPNVTTTRTSSASHRRRKNQASFACTVPGCGSTFTRSFNLKGHMRSHNEERPFQCHWPGCGKGFARQHDCKRHEQLHSNYRPFMCEGCNKPFARMDALNRHLKSDGGSECIKLQGGVVGEEGDGMAQRTALSTVTKTETADIGWSVTL